MKKVVLARNIFIQDILKDVGECVERYWDYMLDVMTLNWQETGFWMLKLSAPQAGYCEARISLSWTIFLQKFPEMDLIFLITVTKCKIIQWLKGQMLAPF